MAELNGHPVQLDRGSSSEKGLIADGITHHFGSSATVLDDVSLRVDPGELVGLVGPSGAGKSTLARVLTGRLRSVSGRVLVDGREQSYTWGRMRPTVALIGQDPRGATTPRWSLRQIIAEPLLVRAAHLAPAEVTARVDGVADRVMLDRQLLDRPPAQVSDGQLQRACIARALVQDATYLVCDEPTSMLDPISTATVMTVLAGAVEVGKGVLVISHDHRLLRACATRIEQLDLPALSPHG